MQSAAVLPESTLMQRVTAGDASAFEELYRRHGRGAFLLARRLGAPRELAEEIVQDAFLSMWRRADRFRAERGSVGAWLNTIVRNAVTDAWRRQAARPQQVPGESAPELPARPVADLPVAERLAVREVVAELPREQRDAIVLSYYGGLTHEQIASVSATPLGTVKGRLRLGIEKLRCTMPA
jgi:RNA polymerase sigma-70 factor (ECF subfamily)